MVNVYPPVGVFLPVATVSVELVAGGRFTDVGLSMQVDLGGQPLTVRPTVPINPFAGVTVTVYVVLLPCLTDRDEGEAEIPKSGAFTTSCTVVEWVRVPLVPVIVRV